MTHTETHSPAGELPWKYSEGYRVIVDAKGYFLGALARAEDNALAIRSVNALPSLVEALEKSAEAWANALELGLLPKQHRITAANLRDEARAALALAKGDAQ